MGVRLTAEQLGKLERQRIQQLIERFRRGLPASLALCVLVAVLTPRALAHASLWIASGPPVLVAVMMAVFTALSYVRALQPRFSVLVLVMAGALVGTIGLQAGLTGGYLSPVAATLFLIWTFGSTVLPMPWRQFAVGAGLHLVAFVAAVELSAPRPGPRGLFIGIALGVAAFCVLGCWLRDSASARIFELTESLEERVAQQTSEIVARARQIELLNKQLQSQVQERSRELAAALARLHESSSASGDPVAGDVVGGRVRIERRIGRGGMGAVYLGEDLATRQPVALKIMRAGLTDPTLLRRFVDEAAAAAQISHPGIVRTLHIDVADDGRIFHVQEFVDGVTLAQRLQLGPFGFAAVARLGAEIARALSAAHRAGVVHRDVKPGNLILSSGAPGIRVLDFGLSKILEADGDSTHRTQTHQIMGTPAYMSPEQVRDAARVTVASDIYSLGVVLYEMASAALPYPDVAGRGLYVAHLSDDPRPLGEAVPDVPADLARMVHRCLEKKAAARPTAQELVFHLTHLADTLGAPAADAVARAEISAAETDTHPALAR